MTWSSFKKSRKNTQKKKGPGKNQEKSRKELENVPRWYLGSVAGANRGLYNRANIRCEISAEVKKW